jgi:predicted ATPase/DNA-binding CsgD family transcriptional regulator
MEGLVARRKAGDTMATGRSPFVGRERELAALSQRLAEAGRGEGGVVFISGEPGIGKSRLLLEFQACAQAAGWLVLSGRAYDTEGMPPYLAFAEAIAQHLRAGADDDDVRRLAEAAREVALLVPELREHLPDSGDRPSLGPEATRYRLFEAVSDFFLRLSATGEATGLLLCLDDLHWADRSTLLLFQHLTRKLRGARVLVVGTFRTEEVDHSRRLFEVLAELAREQQEQLLTLARLSPDETSSLVAGLSGATPSAALVRAIHHQTEGNPFFVQEVVRHLQGQEHGLAGAAPRPEDWGLSEGVREVIGRRLSRLDLETQRLLESAAVLGDGFDVALLRIVAGSDAVTVMRALEEAELAGMLREQGRSYAFGHALIRQVIYEGLSLPRRQALHLRAAEAIETIHAAGLDRHLSALATHYRLAGAAADPAAGKALRYSKLAAEQAEAASSWDEAARHYEACLTLMAASEEALDLDEASLLLRHGSAARYAGDLRKGWQSLMRSLDLFRARKDAEGAGHAALVAMAMPLQAPVARRIAVLDLALGTEGERDPAIEAALLAHRAVNLGFPAGDADADRAEALCKLTAAPEASGLANEYRGSAAWLTNQPEESCRLHKAAVNELLEHGLRATACHPFTFYLQALKVTGRLDDFEAATLRYEKLAREIGDTVHITNAGFEITCLAFLRGDFATVLARLSDGNYGRPTLAVCLAEARGELAGIEKLVVPIEEVPDVDLLILGATVPRAEAFFLAGDHEAAKVELARMEELVPRIHVDTWGELLAAPALIALGSDEAIHAMYERYSARPGMRATSTGSVDRIRGQLALRLGLVDEAAEWFRFGLEWCERERCPVEAGLCLLGVANVAEHRGNHAEAITLFDRASALFSQYGAKGYLDRAIAAREALMARGSIRSFRPSYPGGLTAREVEVLRLIAQGKSNREIGVELVLSLRTVERHMVNIYSKLDIHSKAQATAYAFRHDLAPSL